MPTPAGYDDRITCCEVGLASPPSRAPLQAVARHSTESSVIINRRKGGPLQAVALGPVQVVVPTRQRGYDVEVARFEEWDPAGLRQVGAFTEPERWRFDREQRYTPDQWLEQVPTFGGHTNFPPAQLDDLLAGMGAVVDATGGSV
jgi:hypothetical protein